MQLVSVAALAENRVIGKDGEVPWPHIEADVRQYRDRVAGSPVIVGRRTFESMLDDLPGSRQIVVSRSLDSVDAPTAVVASDVDEAIELAERIADRPEPVAAEASPPATAPLDGDVAAEEPPTADADDPVYVLGGGAIYELFAPHVDRMALSHVDGAFDGDTYFPAWAADEWRVADETDYDRFTLREWVRNAPSS